MLDLLKKMPTNSNPAELSDQISTLQVDRSQRWSDLVTPTDSGIDDAWSNARRSTDDGNFIQMEHRNVGHTKRLVITRKQKQELLDLVESALPGSSKIWDSRRSSGPNQAKTAKLYTKVFDGRKCSDE